MSRGRITLRNLISLNRDVFCACLERVDIGLYKMYIRVKKTQGRISVARGDMLFVCVWHLYGNRESDSKYPGRILPNSYRGCGNICFLRSVIGLVYSFCPSASVQNIYIGRGCNTLHYFFDLAHTSYLRILHANESGHDFLMGETCQR